MFQRPLFNFGVCLVASIALGCSSGGGGGNNGGTTGSNGGTTGSNGGTTGSTGGTTGSTGGTTGSNGGTTGGNGGTTGSTGGTTGNGGSGGSTTPTGGTTGNGGSGGSTTPTGGSGGSAGGTTGAGGIEAAGGAAMSTGCGMDPDTTGTTLPYNGMTFYKKSVTFAGKGGASVSGEYLIALPANYAKSTPSKIGFEMGGFTRDAIDCIYGDCWGFSTEGHKANAIVVAMTQINSGPLHPGQNAMPQAGWELTNELENNVAFFKAVKADIFSKYCVDTNHVFVAGGSSGGDMAHYLGCWMGDELRGIASVGGCMANTIAPVAGKAAPVDATMPNGALEAAPARGQEDPMNICLHTMDFGVCKGNVAVLMVHGFKDPHIPYAEARLTRDAWSPKNACGTGPTTPLSLTDLHTMISTGGANKIKCVDAPSCNADYPVRWCEHSEGGYDGSTHGWPSNATENPDGAGTDIWAFWNSLK
ncbi:MAG TPA: hypothetical protein VHJ20_20805 [Polyangia bacterium]|nr:hypothetical protein [Polyangia bacterium]